MRLGDVYSLNDPSPSGTPGLQIVAMMYDTWLDVGTQLELSKRRVKELESQVQTMRADNSVLTARNLQTEDKYVALREQLRKHRITLAQQAIYEGNTLEGPGGYSGQPEKLTGPAGKSGAAEGSRDGAAGTVRRDHQESVSGTVRRLIGGSGGNDGATGE